MLVPGGAIAPELAYVTAKFAALTPFARVADLLSELLPIGSAANAGTVRNRTLRAGSTVAQLTSVGAERLDPDAVTAGVNVGLDGGYVRSRHPRPERNFEIGAGKVVGSDGMQRRFAFPRNGGSAEWFAQALVRAGVRGHTPATVLSDGDAGLRNLQRRVLPRATVVLDWFHIAMRFQHAAGRGRHWCRHRRRLCGHDRFSGRRTCGVAALAWSMAGMLTQARSRPPLDGDQENPRHRRCPGSMTPSP